MKCEKCLTNEATFHSVTNINGKVSEKHLCSECAKNEKDFDKIESDFLNFSNRESRFFDDMFGDYKSTFSYFSNPLLDSFFDFDNFFESPLLLETNPFYENFGSKNQQKSAENSLKNGINLGKNNAKNSEKMGKNNAKNSENLSKNSLKNNEKFASLSEKEKKQLEIAKLDLMLKKAVVEEKYEDAIQLRDKIKELKNELNK